MADATMYGESDYVCAELINSLADSQGVIVEVNEEEKTYQGKKSMKLVASVSFEGGRVKEWTIPATIVKMFIASWGKDYIMWSGKKAMFMASGKNVVAKPLPNGLQVS